MRVSCAIIVGISVSYSVSLSHGRRKREFASMNFRREAQDYSIKLSYFRIFHLANVNVVQQGQKDIMTSGIAF
jgi:hypothetical protein